MLAEKFIKSSVVYVILGMGVGIYMAASKDHSQMPVHAHMNLLGWLGMAVMGLVYKTWPAVAAQKLAALTFWLSHIVVIGLSVGIGGLYAGYPAFEPIAIIASFVALANMLLFAFLFYRHG